MTGTPAQRAPPPTISPWARGATLVAAAAAFTLAGCGDRGASGENAPRRPAAVTVGPENIAVARMGELRVGPVVSGALEPQRAATVRAEVSGPVVQTYVERGQTVRQGQLLLRIDDAALAESYRSAQSSARSARLALDDARRDVERNTALEKAGAIAERDLEAAQRALSAAQATYADAEARLTSARQQLEKTRVRAPFSGAVSDRPVNAGDVVQPGTALITIVDPSSMRFEAAVPAEAVSALRVGAPVQFRVSGYPGRTFTGRIDRINPAADPATRQVRLSVSIPNDERTRLVAGLFAEGRVATEMRRALLAPITAVDERGVTPTVTRLAGGKAERVSVQLGIRDESTGEVEVSSGLAAGDTLLVGASGELTPGTPVIVSAPGERAAVRDSALGGAGRDPHP